MVVSIDDVLKVYSSILDRSLSYEQADRWAWDKIDLFDKGKLKFDPTDKEEIIWSLILYLYGIDIPDMEDRSKPARSHLDIIDFLKGKKLYGN